MKLRLTVGSSLAVVLLVGGAMAVDNEMSGPQVGSTIPGPFSPLNINGPSAGEKACQV